MNSSKAIAPVEAHLSQDSEVGERAVKLAAQVGVPLSFDLLKLPPEEARHELAWRIARHVLYRGESNLTGSHIP